MGFAASKETVLGELMKKKERKRRMKMSKKKERKRIREDNC